MINFNEKTEKIKSNISKIIIGKEDKLNLFLTAILANGHILLEDSPGTGKTTLAKAIAKSIDAEFNRIQFTPDLLPSDITGINIFNPEDRKFNFIKGPVFCNILLADEINRATPRTQSSLLEAMEERQVTTDGVIRKLESPFLVIATQNPIETIGTFPLPEAQMDRFMMKLEMGYPSLEQEIEIIDRYIEENPLEKIGSVCTKEDVMEMQEYVKKIFVHPILRKYIAEIVQATRDNNLISLGVSPRGTLALIKASQAYAALNGRSYVVPEDIKKLTEPVLAHRIITYNNNPADDKKILQDVVKGISVPTEKWEK